MAGWNWDFGDGLGVSILQDPQHVYFFAGTYDVTLVATHEDGCMDTVVKPNFITLAGPAGNFSIDPPEVCLGDTVCITIFTDGAVNVQPVWQDGFADNIPASGGQDTITICHVYNFAGVFSPQVIVVDAGGCQVDLNSQSQDSVIVFNNPTAVIAPMDTSGCIPLGIPFRDQSVMGDSAIVAWNWTFGDGDSSNLQNPSHIYMTEGMFNVGLTVRDTNGCESDTVTTVTTYSGVIGDFMASDTVGCAPSTITFTDLSSNVPATGWIWAFGDGDTLFGASTATHTYLNDGIYTVTLIVNDGLGCSDTLVKPNYIRLRHPDAVITSNVTQGCNPLIVSFSASQSVSDTTIVQYEWCLTEINTGQTVCSNTAQGIDSLSVNFTEPGNYVMTVAVTDVFGCSDTSENLTLNIDPRVIPDPIEMRNVSVVDDNTVEMSWVAYPGQDFLSYAVHRTNGPNPGVVATFTDQNITTFTENNPLLDARNNSYCYKVLVQNICEEFSRLDATDEHCTIDLETTQGIDLIDLNWTPYAGYPVGQYEVYRALSYDINTLVQIGVVPGNIISFTDTAMFCRDSVTYRILAVGFGGTDQRSYSDLSANVPFHPEPVESTDVIAATVVDDDFVEVSWTTYTGYRPGSYVLERSTDGNDWAALDTVPFTTQVYQDTTALVDTASYYYRVFNIDACGDISALGRLGRTIFLNVRLDRSGTVPILTWNPYEDWANGVLNYEVQVFNDLTELWEVVTLVPGNQLNFEDDITQLNQATYCYRIVAYEVGGNSATSVSNERCVTFGPDVFAPSGFTPNNDGHNDEYQIFVPNLRNGEMLIYDRWGELIFRTSDPNNRGWDGTYKGRPVQEGVYVFVIKGTGVDGSTFMRSGTVTLVR